MFLIGKRYTANPTAMNRKHGIPPNAEAYITFVDPVAISIVVHVAGGAELRFRVPRNLFGVNFKESDPFMRTPNLGYAQQQHSNNQYG